MCFKETSISGGLLISIRKCKFVIACSRDGRMKAEKVILGTTICKTTSTFKIRNEAAQRAEAYFQHEWKQQLGSMDPAIKSMVNKRLEMENRCLANKAKFQRSDR